MTKSLLALGSAVSLKTEPLLLASELDNEPRVVLMGGEPWLLAEQSQSLRHRLAAHDIRVIIPNPELTLEQVRLQYKHDVIVIDVDDTSVVDLAIERIAREKPAVLLGDIAKLTDKVQPELEDHSIVDPWQRKVRRGGYDRRASGAFGKPKPKRKR